ncbi:hypothetical protein GV827_15505 [Sulfitobacter sp. JBTF-M27]|uniref:Uncharacterized protein n=1 Tax=Sulfitobacter sediminilitoris TaxID=2698830 RepID=A0A6P0CH59_9RHOB|nr:hypothetical protein [Sulfitobacter sediminilitoris]NEK23803.1 hypothetical protein [Sulfitobacter sediminilitoris]
MPFFRIAAASLALAATSSCVDIAWTTDKKHVVLFDEGGWIQWYDDQVKDLTARGIRPELRGRHCSAATMLLGVPGVCVHPKAEFGFHGCIPVLPGETKEMGDNQMRKHYNPALRAWYDKNARHLQFTTKKLTGQQLHDMFGYDLCETVGR